ncbi:MAG TPA: M56 family metallopeptidase [Rhodanobacter sp.]|nr:M56 family metallopeptidase [Rhodanobacter sp.]
MNSIEWAGIDWLGRGWLLILAFTAAVLVAAALRRPCRRLFGTERAFQLWLLPPLAMLASQLPHAAMAPVSVLPSVVSTITAAAITLPATTAAATAVDWRVFAALLWLAGSVGSLLLAALAQSRYRVHLRGAMPVAGVRSCRPVLRAISTDVGPALVGAWRSRIVLPADFERRYDAVEQALILAHEATHARRGDGWWCLLGQFVAAIFWFHPLGWWALAALRHDQELACDAAVLREHGAQRRSYANAMLKTQSAAFALPVGCPWSPRHPVTERIAMLKRKQPDLFRRRAGGVLVALTAVGLSGLVYAATPSPQAATGTADHYTLKIDAVMGGRPGSRQLSYCLRPNEHVDVNGADSATGKFTWKGRFAVAAAAKGQIEIRSQIDTRFDRGNGAVREESGKPIVRTMPGQQATIVFGQIMEGKQHEKLEDNTIKLAMTPSIGCYGMKESTRASHAVPMFKRPVSSSTMTFNHPAGSARQVARLVADRGGMVLVNPDVLDASRPLSGNFYDGPAADTLQFIAFTSGMKAKFDGIRVTFVPK